MMATDFPATIYHNPACGTSRNTLALIRHAGIEPKVVLYLETPLSRDRVIELVRRAGLTVREALREKGTPFEAMGLADRTLSEDQLLDAILREPILLNRPFVETRKGVRLCRPSEVVLDLLPPITTPFVKEDGEIVAPPSPPASG
jgi:arsenate reductase (glutaredoxin)